MILRLGQILNAALGVLIYLRTPANARPSRPLQARGPPRISLSLTRPLAKELVGDG